MSVTDTRYLRIQYFRTYFLLIKTKKIYCSDCGPFNITNNKYVDGIIKKNFYFSFDKNWLKTIRKSDIYNECVENKTIFVVTNDRNRQMYFEYDNVRCNNRI